MISAEQCIRCKGRFFCGMRTCPILEKFEMQKSVVANIVGDSFTGSSPPGLFVGWHGYPKVSIGPLSPTEVCDSLLLDMPERWFGLPPEQIISFRQRLVRGSKSIDATAAAKPSYELAEMQELVMSIAPTAIEVKLKGKPSPRLSFHESIAPIGPSAPLASMSLQENPSVPRKIDSAVSDTDLKANDALLRLYDAGFPVSTLHKLLSAGTLGVGKNRRLVPTRWSITAVDSNISEALVEEKVKQFPQISEVQLFHSNYLDNDFWVLLVPSAWAFEQLECWLPGASWALNATQAHLVHDHEFYGGRTTYASNVEGAYYSARLAVAEFLAKEKRQAAAIVFREIGEGYQIPLGVWQIRENVRNALGKQPLRFGSLALALEFLRKKLRVPMERYKKESTLIDALLHQKRITDFF
ncbi:MAG: Nre family DNA repair protein [Candidatus Diapherotrites archaeon]|nr:Nre family DNA repair protein [Candidatus Diapherotrites archaeon]